MDRGPRTQGSGIALGCRLPDLHLRSAPVCRQTRNVTDLAEPGQGLTLEELQLATRNRGMPLEGLRYDLTPTGIHYLLVHFDIPAMDESAWRLEISGNVRTKMSLTLEDIRARPSRTIPVTLECAGNGRARLIPRPISNPWLIEAIGTARWTGTSLRPLLEEAGMAPGTAEIVFTGADRGIQGEVEHNYQRSLSVQEASRPEVLLAYEMNGRPLEPQHGFPLRLLVPGWYGMTSVKWLTKIEASTQRFDGYQQSEAYHFKQSEDEPGEPVNRIRIRALMLPPGIPEFMTRRRYVAAGKLAIKGRAWCGSAPVEKVELGVDGEWTEARLDPAIGEWAWRGWSCDWEATPGDHELSCRATDADGNRQPIDQPWNLQGLGNNQVQKVFVTVR